MQELTTLRHDWSVEEAESLMEQPFNDLIHRAHFDPNLVQVSTLLNVKTGACPEDCGYCSQSARNDSGLAPERLMALDEVVTAAVEK